MERSDLFNNPLFPQFHKVIGWNTEDEFNHSDIKILFVFPSAYGNRILSDTHSVLYSIVKESFGANVFVDVSIEPNDWCRAYYYKTYPAIVGSVSKRTWDEFDIVAFSFAILTSEFAEAYWLMKKAGIPLFSKDRLENDRMPLIVSGGVSVDKTACFNDIVDLQLIGFGERTIPNLINTCYIARSHFGSVKKAKGFIIEKMSETPGVCVPSAYSYESWVEGGIAKSKLVSVRSGFPLSVSPDVDLSVEKYGYLYDKSLKFPLPISQRKASVLSSFGCSGGNSACNFCHEGTLYGAWRERNIEDLSKALETEKRFTMGESFSYYSFNSNYHSEYGKSLEKAYEYFDNVSTINLRCDCLAASVRRDRGNNYLTMLKRLGAVSISSPFEGVSERVRNGLFNKNLTSGEIIDVDKLIFDLKFLRVKHGLILSGYENKYDWDEFRDFTRRIKDLRDSCKSNTQVSFNSGYLVHDFGTPLYHLPKYTSLMSWYSRYEKTFFQTPLTELTDLGFYVWASSGRGETHIQQLLQDLPGDIARRVILEPALKYPVLSAKYYEEVKRKFLEEGLIPKKQFLELDTDNCPNRHLKIGHNPLKIYKFDRDDNYSSSGLCIRTQATVDKSSVIPCISCGSCGGIDLNSVNRVCGNSRFSHSKWLHEREIEETDSYLKILETKEVNSSHFYYTFIFSITKKGQNISKELLVRKFFSACCDFDESFVTNFRSITSSTFRFLEYPQYPSMYDGIEICVVGFKDRIDMNVLRKASDKLSDIIRCISCNESSDFSFNRLDILFGLHLNIPIGEINKFIVSLKVKGFVIPDGIHDKIKYVKLPFRYKVVTSKDGYLVFIAVSCKVNPVFSLMTLYPTPRAFLSCGRNTAVKALSGSGGVYSDIITGERFYFEGFESVELDTESDQSEAVLADIELCDDNVPTMEGA